MAGTFCLRGLRPDDAGAIHTQVNDWNVIRMLSRLPFPYPRDLAERWITSAVQQAEAGTAYHFAVENQAGVVIGCIGLTLSQTDGHCRGSLGYWIGREHWRQGIATLASDRLCGWAFANLPLDTIEASVAQDNVASVAVLNKLGFRQTGVATQVFTARGGNVNVLLFSASRESFDTAHENKPLADTDTSPQEAAEPRRLVLVVAAALIDASNRILLARRPEGKTLAGLWEFPGGKMEPGEAPETSLIRELREELGIDASTACLAPFTFVSHSYEKFDLLMPIYLCRQWQGQPEGREGQKLAWVEARDLDQYPMPPADIPVIPFLRDLL
ncbi:8-oxo-dGTP diphosphatase MutT [Acetobacter sp.]|jgi:8-oxo-dGTP diphosphatase|uniref:8-oxo-dGTP diphosphatase MutT n=1 Tax=Acetobacter sp. TaxID=440 RepID=UPI0025C3B168|nr:8-oxo-dGTP diphosphatase MutT [Acetobacter sp.]MCH4090290.1 8-oxo-dGTP diphosphatase MutT [Acetobacter sp.]MCI1298984.1 8-oxo-dGTP diphosphatase MutT [Acetobacter sp.]MCI1315004.1 8-oxo-dGTP diphosphatase MutT [Acetobacter sp.]